MKLNLTEDAIDKAHGLYKFLRRGIKKSGGMEKGGSPDGFCKEVFRAGLAAKDFPKIFPQRHFRISYNRELRMQSASLCNQK